MSSSAQIQSIRRQEQKKPVDLIRDGKSYRFGHRIQSETVRKLRAMRKKEAVQWA